MSNLTDLQDALDLLILEYKSVLANPKPNYSKDGQSISHSDYLKDLLEQILKLKTSLGLFGDTESGGDFTVLTRGRI